MSISYRILHIGYISNSLEYISYSRYQLGGNFPWCVWWGFDVSGRKRVPSIVELLNFLQIQLLIKSILKG